VERLHSFSVILFQVDGRYAMRVAFLKRTLSKGQIMKKQFATGSVIALVALFSSVAMAHGKGKGGPCAPVWKACAAKDKASAKTCTETIKGGGTVEGVTVADADLKACQGAAAAK
jgi:hypothetical protein